MIREALDDAGLTIDDVDAVFSNTSAGWAPTLELAEYLGISPRWTDSTNTGGSSFEIHVEHAAAAIALGLCDVALDRLRRHATVVVQARDGRLAQPAGRRRRNPQAEWEMPYGLRMPMGAYALAASRHLHEFGTTSEQLAQIAVDTRQWAR